MNPIDILIDSKLSKLNLDKDTSILAKNVMNIYGVEDGYKYFKIAKKLSKTAKLRNIDIDTLHQCNTEKEIKSFIDSAMHSFDKIISTDNKNDRTLIKLLENTKLPLDDFCFITERKKDFRLLLKQRNIDFEKNMTLLKESIENNNLQAYKISIEYQNDDIEKSIIASNANKLKRSIISNKYKHLINQETEDIFIECSKQGVTKEQFRQSVAPKIAAMKNPEDFNELLGQVIGMNIDWDTGSLTKKAAKNETDVLSDNDGVVYLEINNFSDSQSFGSRMWCITREDDFLQTYLYASNSRVVFRLDTNKDIKDPESYIALLYKGTELNEVYDKNDKLFYEKDELFQKMKNINLPRQSENSKFKKIAQYNKIVKDADDFNMRNITYLTLLDLKAFDLLDFYEDNKDNYYDWPQYNLYESESNEVFLKSHIPNFDKEQINYIFKSGSCEKLSGTTSKTKDVVFSEILRTTNDKELIDFVLTNMKEKTENKNSLKILNSIFENKNSDVFNYFVKESKALNLDMSDIFSASVTKNIPDVNIQIAEKENSDFIKNVFLNNPKVSFINVFSSNERSPQCMASIMKNKIMKTESVQILKDKFENRIKKIDENSRSENDKEYVKAMELSQKKEKKLKIR